MRVSPEAFAAAVDAAAAAGARFPQRDHETRGEMLQRIRPLFFDPDFHPMVTNKSPGPGRDLLESSANNLYHGVSMKDLDGFDERYGLNSRLVKRDGRLIEEVYRIGGRYDAEISAIVKHLRAAIRHAPPPMARALEALVTWYQTGEADDRRAYDMAWVEDQHSAVDTINGFTEVYMDARGVKGSWEAVVCYVNPEKTRTIRALAANAQWFEDRLPSDPRYRRQGVRGIVANAIEVVVEAGDAAPVTPIGINLPNDQTVRERHGSKSVLLSNVVEAYDRSTPDAYRREFAWDDEEVERSRTWGSAAMELLTTLHEVIGHGSGRLADHVRGDPGAALRELYSTIEETRADLVGLYFIADPKLVDLGIVDAAAHDEIVRTEYEAYARNALLQLRRVRQGSTLEEDHMRNRQLVVQWLMTETAAIERRTRDGKTYYVLVDRQAFREGAGRLLSEVQRIKSEGDYGAARTLVDTHGVHFDPALRDEIVARVDRVGFPAYTAFVQPRLKPTFGANGSIADVTITYPLDLTQQMLEYSGKRLAP
jgi:dipeptidyl-peptidase-3